MPLALLRAPRNDVIKKLNEFFVILVSLVVNKNIAILGKVSYNSLMPRRAQNHQTPDTNPPPTQKRSHYVNHSLTGHPPKRIERKDIKSTGYFLPTKKPQNELKDSERGVLSIKNMRTDY